jgi:hypothetical protein
VVRTTAANGPIDWNDDGDVADVGVNADVSRIDSVGCGDDNGDTIQDGTTLLTGFNDWANIVYDFRASRDFADGIHTNPHEVPPITSEQALAAAQSVDFDGDGIPNYPDNCPAIANPNQADTDADDIGNVCDNCPTAPNPDQADGDGDGIGDACEESSSSPVGGIAELPDVAHDGARPITSCTALAGLAAATLLALTAGAQYARRRWLR